MDILYKFLKVFNSAQKPWQVTLAIVLGMITGFLPVSGLQTVIVFLIALVVNVPLGIYFFFAAQFALIGYFLDPLFESLGYSLLHAEALNGMWTAFYNIGFIRLTNFDNTIVLGSTVVALLFSVPLYFIVRKLLDVYRDRIVAFLEKIPFLSKLGIFKISDKVIKTLRMWGFALFAVIMVLVVVFVFVFMDSLFKRGLEKGLGAVLDKEVVIKDLEVDLSGAALNIAGLEIQNKDTQTAMMYIDEISADMDFNALLMAKTHVDHINVKGMSFGQALKNKRAEGSTEESGTQAASSSSETSSTATTQTSEAPSGIELPKVEDLLKSEDLKSSKLAETAKKEYQAISTKWNDVLTKEFSPSFRKSFTQDLNAIKAQAKDIKRINDTKKKVEAFNKKVNTTKARIATLKREFQADKKLLENRIAEIKKAKDEDLKALKSKYSFDKGGAINVLGTLLGTTVKGYLDTANEYYEQVAPYLSSDDVEAEPTPKERHKGRWIKFKEEVPTPGLLIKKVDIDGKFRSQTFQGLVTDITDDQKALGTTTKLKIVSNGDDIKNMVIKGEENRMGAKAVTTLNYSAQKVNDTAFDLAFISLKDSDMAVKGNFKMIEGKMTNKTRLTFTKADLRTKNIQGKIGKALQKDLKATKTFTVDINAKGALKAPDLQVRSSLETVVANSLKRMMRAEVKAFENKLNKELSKMVGRDIQGIDLAKLSGIDKALGSNDQELNKAKSDAQKELDKAKPKVDKKKLKNFLKF